ncbi:carboxyvinyl-carboxyphosphonate phosphorylmutase [Sulfitobacter sp. SK012]|uniref:isocitrate lyase/PEP mutase family protein n=1 Tax=Sulfitobacter sp. SK012 TaxID=1389005 RepID=UPI000E0AAF31|nr:isocitrate lyase/PEP mutase family protein [Sulfitobacter sp. SK012]AXI48270.1 carboxyvinyl-carboxyphosphonate phosphorylmutase [Sulfitobacter sp. SK012]
MPETVANPMADRLRALIARGELIKMPCCFDALSAKLIEQAGFDLTFLSGFGASASRLGAPDTGLMSYGEVLDQARNAMRPLTIPMMVDGDTGHDNPMNVMRTVTGFARAGCAAVMIEDQVAPKRCGHTMGKSVVCRSEAIDRIHAAVEARADHDIMILARTDARREHGLDEALARAEAFAKIGADILFVEEPYTIEEMATICSSVDGVHMANMLEGGQTPILPPETLAELGYSIAAYPLTLLSAAMKAMNAALVDLAAGRSAQEHLLDFADLRAQIGFEEYHRKATAMNDRAR